jgi:diaminopimelate epimerase
VDGVEAALVVDPRKGVITGRRFYKMTGSGNDFVVFDSRDGSVAELIDSSMIRRLCDRRQGIGADGVVIIEPSTRADLLMKYFNSDGSRGAMCGNAALCVTRLASQLRLANPGGMAIETDDGIVKSRLAGDGPEIELQPIRHVRSSVAEALEAGEQQLGYAVAGVPHIVVLCNEVERVDVAGRGAALRNAEWTLPDGANVNFVSKRSGAWAMRTFERGVEGETLACGTGAVAVATLLEAWGLSGRETALRTRSGCVLEVVLRERAGMLLPSLRGDGRLVFEGELREG